MTSNSLNHNRPSLPEIFASADSNTNLSFSETNPVQTVHAYSSNTYVSTNQLSDSNSNEIFLQVYGFVENPLDNNDPKNNYYIFDVYESVSSLSGSGWSVDSGGKGSSNGPTLNVTISACNNLGEQILQGNIWPNSELDPAGDNTPETTSLDLSYGGLSFGISHTFTAPKSQTDYESPTDSCRVSWYELAIQLQIRTI